MITCVCPSCEQKLRVPDDVAGKKVKCPRCSSAVSVSIPPKPTPPPSEAATLAPPPAPAPSEVLTVALPPASVPASEQPTRAGDATLTQNREGALSLLAPPQASDEIGRLGDYRVLSLLGQGGMGAVFKAEDTQLNRRVALKVILPDLADEMARKRFLREARAAAAIEHANIVPIFQVGEVDVPAVGKVPFLAMPLLRGETLEALLKRKGKLSTHEIAEIGGQVAVGLAAAHDQGLVHRDIKPGNIWLEEKPIDPVLNAKTRREMEQIPRWIVKILDFGLARGADAEDEPAPVRANRQPKVASKKGIETTMLTQDGAIVGTPAYMSPEQVNGHADSRSDLFSLGCVLYQMSTGELPFKGADTMDTLIAVTTEDPPPPSKLNKKVPAPLSKLVMRLLEKDPADRPKSAVAVAKRLSVLHEAHRGLRVLLMGIFSLACLLGACCYGLTCTVGVLLGGLGWWMAHVDSRKIRTGVMDKAGAGQTQAGYICSVLGFFLNGLAVLSWSGFCFFIFNEINRQRPQPYSPPPTLVKPPTPQPPPIVHNVPPAGFIALFNGKDLSGWQIAIDPDKRKKLSTQEYEKTVKEQNDQFLKHWTVKDGVLHYDGKGKGLQTVKEYGNFRMQVDWMIGPLGDGGIEVRGPAQVKFFDPGNADGAENRFGSGGLWYNLPAGKIPQQKADRAVGQWNTFDITMNRDRVEVKLNNTQVLFGAKVANFLEPGQPLPKSGPIALKQHNGSLAFRNIYIMELGE